MISDIVTDIFILSYLKEGNIHMVLRFGLNKELIGVCPWEEIR